MPRLILLLSAGLAFSTTAQAQLMGFTDTPFTGDIDGIFGSTAACQAEFPGSRMCIASEALTTLDPPAIRPPAAWCNTSAVDPALGNAGSINGVRYYCAQCTGGGVDSGATITDKGTLSNELCSVALPIACCIPMPEASAALGLGAGVAMLAALSTAR